MKNHQSVKRVDGDYTDSEDDPASSGEQAKIALRRAKNREAARRVRERRMTAIKTLSEQVETLVEENNQLREQIEQLEAGQSKTPRSAAMSGSSGGIKTASDDIAPTSRSVSVQDVSTQTDPPATAEADVPPTAAGPTSSSAREDWNSSAVQSPASHPQQPQQRQQVGTSPVLASSFPTPQHQQQQQLLNLQQMQMMLQLQMQMLQVQSGGSYTPTSLPAGLHMGNILQSPSGAAHQQQYDKAAAGTVSLSSMGWPPDASATLVPVSTAVPASTALRSPAGGGNLEGPAGAFNATQLRPNVPVKQESSAAAAAAAQQQQLLTQLQQQQQQMSHLQRQPRQSSHGRAAQLPQLQQQQMPVQQPPQLQQLQQQQHAGQQNQQQCTMPASGQGYRQSLQYQQQPGDTQLLQAPQMHVNMSMPAPAAATGAAAACHPQAGAAATSAAAGAGAGNHPSFKPGALLDDDGMLMSAELNLNTAEMNIINTADMNVTSSDFNAMLASEEILKHVPLPEDATASHSTAWL
jgi:hypothetical protein